MKFNAKTLPVLAAAMGNTGKYDRLYHLTRSHVISVFMWLHEELKSPKSIIGKSKTAANSWAVRIT
jgi:hypothetical protein